MSKFLQIPIATLQHGCNVAHVASLPLCPAAATWPGRNSFREFPRRVARHGVVGVASKSTNLQIFAVAPGRTAESTTAQNFARNTPPALIGAQRCNGVATVLQGRT